MRKVIAATTAASLRHQCITIEKLIHELVLYLPTIVEYRHDGLRIDCDRFYRNTTVDLYGQFDERLGRRVSLRVTIDDIATTNLRCELWPEQFVIRLDSADLGLEHSLVVRPQLDQTVDFLQVLRWEQGRPILARPAQRIRCAVVRGDNSFRLHVAGVTDRQQDLRRIVESRPSEIGRCLIPALLVPERYNREDRDAVAVQIEKRTIGYMTRDVAPAFLKALAEGNFDLAACGAAILAWREGSSEQIDFSVRLDAVLPFDLLDQPKPPPTTNAG
jgi:hypothetical protein